MLRLLRRGSVRSEPSYPIYSSWRRKYLTPTSYTHSFILYSREDSVHIFNFNDFDFTVWFTEGGKASFSYVSSESHSPLSPHLFAQANLVGVFRYVKTFERILHGWVWIRKWGECGYDENCGGLPFLPRYPGKTAGKKTLKSVFFNFT